MIDELKIIVELLNGATEKALYAFVVLGFYNLAKIALFVFPILHGVKFIFSKVFVNEDS